MSKSKPQVADVGDPFAGYGGAVVEEVPCVTVTGRRVLVRPFDARMQRVLLAVRKRKDAAAMLTINEQLVTQYVRLAGGRPIPNYEREVLATEEFDMLMLARYYSSSNQRVRFDHECRACHQKTIREFDLSKFRRRLYECGDEDCPCHEVNVAESETWDNDRDNYDWEAMMHDQYDRVPEDHLTASPPGLRYEFDLPRGRRGQVDLRLLKVLDLRAIERAALRDDEHIDDLQLEHLVARINIPDNVGGTDLVDVTSVPVIRKVIERMPPTLRREIDSFAQRTQGGVDDTLTIRCDNIVCGSTDQIALRYSASFFSVQAGGLTSGASTGPTGV